MSAPGRAITFLLPVLLSALTACMGPSVKTIDLAYRPCPAGAMPPAKGGREIVVVKLKDERPVTVLGEASNYGGHVFFTVRTDSDVPAWMTRALATELGKAGFQVQVGEGPAGPDAFMVQGIINEISVKGILSNIRVTLQVSRGFKILSNASYNAGNEGFKEKFINTVYTTDYANLYEVTLQNLMKQVVPQVASAVDNEP